MGLIVLSIPELQRYIKHQTLMFHVKKRISRTGCCAEIIAIQTLVTVFDDGMEVLNPKGQRVYNLTAGKILPEWISEAKKRKLKKIKGPFALPWAWHVLTALPEFRDRIEVLQELYFPAYCSRLKYSPDGEYLVAAGL